MIGNKETFAVEFSPSETVRGMGYGKVWIQGEFFGTNEDLIYFHGYLIALLDEFIHAKTIDFDFKSLNKSVLFDRLHKHHSRDRYLIGGSTFTEDFTAFAFEQNNTIFLIWKLRCDQEMIFSDLVEYGTEIRFCHVEKNRILNVKSKLLRFVDYG